MPGFGPGPGFHGGRPKLRNLDDDFDTTLAAVNAMGQGGVYAPARAGGAFKDVAATQPAGHGDTVAKLIDFSNHGNHFLQADAAKRPVLNIVDGLGWLEPDGVNDYMALAANLDLSAYTGVVLSVGLHKDTDTAAQIVMQFGAFGNNGTWRMTAPNAAVNKDYAFYARGSTSLTRGSGELPAPDSNVVTGVADIAPLGVNDFRSSIRIAGEDWNGGTNSIGAGNWANTTLHLFTTNLASSNFYSGRFYGGAFGVGHWTEQIVQDIEALPNALMGWIY